MPLMKQRSRQKVAFILFAFLASVEAAANTTATPGHQSETLTVKADRLELNQDTGVQKLSGSVVITQADIIIYADTLTVTTINGAISRIHGTGSPIRFQQELGGGEMIFTESREIDYVTSSWTLAFRGDVILRRGSWQLGGQLIEYNIRTRNFQASSEEFNSTDSSSKARVNFTFGK